MEATEIPKLVTIAALVGGLEDKIERMGCQRITVSDHMNGLSYTADNKSDNFIIDMESLAAKDAPVNSRIARSLSRKWSHRCSDEKVIQNNNANENKNEYNPIPPSSSPRGGQGVVPVPEKSMGGTTADQHCSNQQSHHQITITAIATTTNKGTTVGESRCGRRNSFRRSSSSWILEPKRILYIFATLSSIGTILLIYFTLSIGETVLDSEQ